MKKIIITLFVFQIVLIYDCFSQPQLRRWYFPSQSVDMTQPTPQVSVIAGATATVNEVSNGAYSRLDPNGAPMFYIADNQVFDKTNNNMGGLSVLTQRTTELCVVPFPENQKCTFNKYYIIYNSPNLLTLAADIKFQVVDMNGNGGLGTLSSPQVILSVPTCEIAGLAVGLKQANSRNLYVCGGTPFGVQSIFKVRINVGTTFTITQLFNGSGLDFESAELDINQDETKLAFASVFFNGAFSLNRYFVFNLGVNTLQQFNVGTDNSSGVRGVEFYLKGATYPSDQPRLDLNCIC